MLGLPEATGAHMEPALTLLKADERRQVLVIGRDLLLAVLDDLFGGLIDQVLHLSWLILLVREVAADHVINSVLNTCFNVGEGAHVFLLVSDRLSGVCRRVVVSCLDHILFYEINQILNYFNYKSFKRLYTL